jgi:hypothetical protein
MDEHVYLHIGNGGVSFRVSDDLGPTIHITATHFGNVTHEMKLHVERSGLRALGEMFLRAAEEGEFSEPYVCAAKWEGEAAVSTTASNYNPDVDGDKEVILSQNPRYYEVVAARTPEHQGDA